MKYILTALIVLFLATPGWTGEIKATWDYPYEVSDLEGFKLYHEGEEVADIDDPEAREWQGEVPDLKDGENSFSLTAYDAEQESEPDTTTHNPVPPSPDGFTVSVTVNVTVNGGD